MRPAACALLVLATNGIAWAQPPAPRELHFVSAIDRQNLTLISDGGAPRAGARYAIVDNRGAVGTAVVAVARAAAPRRDRPLVTSRAAARSRADPARP